MKSSSDLDWEFGAIPMIEPEYLGGILATSSDIALLIDQNATVHSILVNSSEKSVGNLSHWEGCNFNNFLTVESKPKLQRAIDRIKDGETIFYGLELNHEDNALWQFPVRYNIHSLGDPDKILLLGRDLRSLSENQQRLIQAQLAVERSIEEKREFDAHFKILLNGSSEPIAFLNADSGTVLHANHALADLLDKEHADLQGMKLQSCLADKAGKRDFAENLSLAAHGKYALAASFAGEDGPRDVKITSEIFRTAGIRVLMCRLTEEAAQPEDNREFVNNLVSAFHNSSDAIIFTNNQGTIQHANERFLDLVHAGSKSEVISNNLAEYLGRGQIDLALMLENVAKSGSVKVYSTHLKSGFGTKIDVETSVSQNNGARNALIVFIVREVASFDDTRVRAARFTTQAQQDEMSARDLVGTASLKEIVSETTDVIEKICIQAALEMTNNNRAAAAEMLGLSRQSLYVKLSKLDI